MIERIEIGSTPWGEECAQVGQENYYDRAHKECVAYKRQLMRIIGDKVIPDGFALVVKGFSHDFGTYYEVVCRFDGDDQDCWNLFDYLESNLPEKWDNIALQELNQEAA